MTDQLDRQLDRICVLIRAVATEFIRGPLAIMPRYRFATYVRTEEERGRMSGNWVRAGEHATAMTFETAWNTPHSTIAGYQQVGRGRAQSVASFLVADDAPQGPAKSKYPGGAGALSTTEVAERYRQVC